jgi:lipopolysaccharide/colanic/teichoic acid biosynthesis glycosyltransferase
MFGMALRDEKSVDRNDCAELSGNPVRTFGQSQHGKRAFDVIFAITGLILLSPLLLLASIAIAAESRGPIFIREDLRDHDNRTVRALRFRLVRGNADEPTLTRIGQVLHETGIPELPQLLNVVRGEMSIVGPRLNAGPHNAFSSEAAARLSGLKPGLITWVPPVGHYAVFGLSEQPIHDALHYIDNWSVFLDIKIILMSLFSAHSS